MSEQTSSAARGRNLLLALAGLFGLLAVLAGAFGSHALAARFTPRQMEIWEIGNQYHLIHAAVLLALGLARRTFADRLSTAAGICFALGTLLFAGSQYTIALTGFKSLGMLAPFGGLLLMAGWACLIARGLRSA